VAEPKTKPTDASVDEYLASRGSPEQLADCQVLMKMFRRLTKQKPVMWGPSIVGYGAYRYTYASGHSGEMCRTGFAIRGKDLVVYLVADGVDQATLLTRLGKHKMGKSCLHFKRLADVDLNVLEQLIAGSLQALSKLYEDPAAPAEATKKTK
jgi:hypothetical protein